MSRQKRGLILLSFIVSIFLTSCALSEIKEVAPLKIQKIPTEQVKNLPKLQQNDFDITYKQEAIHKETNIQTIIAHLGYGEGYEDNNNGYISSEDDYRRWNLSYPDYQQPRIRLIVRTNMNTEKEQLAAVSIESPDIRTKRGLKLGDSVDRLYELYGKPTNYNNARQVYSWRQLYMSVGLDEQREKVSNIFIDYIGDSLVDPEERDIRRAGEPWSDRNDYTLVANQSFDLSMSGWQDSRFVSAQYTVEGKEQAAFFITDKQEKRVKYRLEDFYGNLFGRLDRIRAVSFGDINGDGSQDIIILASYKDKNASTDILPIASVYFQRQDGTFTFVPWLDQEMNRRGYNHNLNEIIQYAGQQHIKVH
ncbi:FG-GAP repeat protein [Paenibacillus wulumuqiensis]|uniref:FG-GAP repeat protein n=1 Tax=Paenibacillus wulumuqiensis TaxID=1567107 RepID=UPI000A8087BA|nr:FG-GAP repeat protein [Paenibacillus wulumuqiensis]